MRPGLIRLCLALSIAAVPAVVPAVVPVLATGMPKRALETELLRHPYLQHASATSMVIVWRTAGPIDPVVLFGPEPGEWADLVGEEGVTLRVGPDVDAEGVERLHSAPPDCYQWELELTDLEPDTRYYYAVCDGDDVLAGGDAGHYFVTSPEPGTDRRLRLWVVGDSGTGGVEQAAVFDAMRRHLAEPGHKVDGFLHLGDMAYPDGTDDEFSRNFFGVYKDLLRNTVCWPTMGNHEGHTSRGFLGVGPYYDAYVVPTEGELGGVASLTEAYYSFQLGPIHGVCLDSYDVDRGPDSAMARWLRSDLDRSDAKWRIAFWHHPPYSMGTHDSDRELELREMREHMMPILESAGVDLVLAGHSHTYERSMLIDGAYATPTVAEGVVLDDGDGHPDGDGPYRKSGNLRPHEGTVAIVAGNGGAGLGRRGTMPIMRSILVEHGSVLLDVDGDRMTVTMLNSSGDVRDVCQILKEGEVEPRIVEHPWQPWGPEVAVQRDPADGVNQVELSPRPAAPDGVIHYTVDGSDPDLTSPVFEEPLRLDRTVELRALSVWNGGRRISPVTRQRIDFLPPGSFHRRIQSSLDDVEEGPLGGLNPISSDLEMVQEASRQIVGLRFTELEIPQNSRVVSAAVQFAVNDRGALPTELTITAERSGHALQFANGELNVSSRPRTEASVNWTPPPWKIEGQAEEAQRTPDLSALIQEVVDLPDWRAGNAIVLVITGTGVRSAVSFDGQPSLAPQLQVHVEPRDP